MSYNGWSNYETWNCALWLGNEEYTEEMCADWARSADDVAELATQIMDYVYEENPLGNTASMYSDILSGALREIDFTEIAEHYFADFHEDEPEEDEPDPDEPQDEFMLDGVLETIIRLRAIDPSMSQDFYLRWYPLTYTD